jgi:hypothetical protein
MALMVVAFVLFWQVGTSTGLSWVIAALALAGIGQAFAFNASTTATMNAVPDARSGAAAGVLNGARQLGSVLGIAVTGVLFQIVESSRLLTALGPKLALAPDEERLVAGLLSGSSQARATIAALADLEERPDDAAFTAFVDTTVADAFVAALQSGMVLCAVVSAIGVLVTIGPRAFRRRGGKIPDRPPAIP